MTLLWAILAAMAMAGVTLVLWPLANFRASKDVSSELLNAMVFRDRLQELDADLQQGHVTAEEHQQLKAELELTLLGDVAAEQQTQIAHSRGGKAILWPLLVLIPALALGLYWREGFTPEVKGWLGQQDHLRGIMTLMMAGDYAELEKQQVELPDMIRALQQHVQKNHEDHRSWYVLGMSYLQMQMLPQAELAFSRALDLDGDNPDYLLGFAQASVLLNDGKLTPELHQALRGLIQRHPDNPKPYMTLGMVAFQNGDFAAAIDIWQQYLQREKKDERASALLQRSVTMAQKQLDAVRQADAESAVTGEKPSLLVTVNVTDSVRLKLESKDTLFIYARAVDGPPMPLAAVRQPVGQWPVQARLSDADAVTPMASLSRYGEVIVQARISASGDATPQSGDWIGPTQVIKLQPGEQSVALEINAQMP